MTSQSQNTQHFVRPLQSSFYCSIMYCSKSIGTIMKINSQLRPKADHAAQRSSIRGFTIKCEAFCSQCGKLQGQKKQKEQKGRIGYRIGQDASRLVLTILVSTAKKPNYYIDCKPVECRHLSCSLQLQNNQCNAKCNATFSAVKAVKARKVTPDEH